jgi:hypothetical protein
MLGVRLHFLASLQIPQRDRQHPKEQGQVAINCSRTPFLPMATAACMGNDVIVAIAVTQRLKCDSWFR